MQHWRKGICFTSHGRKAGGITYRNANMVQEDHLREETWTNDKDIFSNLTKMAGSHSQKRLMEGQR
jgi:hypothetical protein